MPVTDWLQLEPLVAPEWAAVVVGLLAAVTVVIAWRRPPRAGPRGRLLLVILRLAVVGAVGLLLLQPVIRWQGRSEVSTSVAVFLDASQSMDIRDMPAAGGEPISRAEAVRRVFLGAGKAYDDFNARCVALPMAFGSSVRPIGSFAPDPVDPRTDIAEALAWALDESAREEGPADRTLPLRSRLGAVILISDGAANRSRGSAEDAARLLAARGIKVHTVIVGSDVAAGPACDISVCYLRAPARVFVGNQIQVRAAVTAQGMSGREVRCSLLVNDEVVNRGAFTPTADIENRDIVFDAHMTRPGLARLAVVTEPVEGELVSTNNRAESAVQVVEGSIRVLYLEGGIRPEGKYLARALGEAAEIDLDRRILLVAQPPSAGQMHTDTAEGGGATPATGAPTLDEIEKYDLVILGDLAASALDRAVIDRIADRVSAARLNLLVLGGQHALGLGGWTDTTLASVLPVQIVSGEGLVPGPFIMQPMSDATGHFIFTGGDSAPMNFTVLPPLERANNVRPGEGEILARSTDGQPLLAVRQIGMARVAAFMADTTYQWVLAPAKTGGEEVHRRFWRQLVMWTAGRDSRPKTDFWVSADRPHYVLADADSPPMAEITVHWPRAAPLQVRIQAPDGETSAVALRRLAEGTEWRAFVALHKPGLYHVTAEAAGRTEQAEFLVTEQDFESAHVLANTEAMERLAQAGGGTFRRLPDLPALMTDLSRTIEPKFEPVERRLPLGGGRVFLATVVLLLTVEWLLRRKWSL
jgi:uncharacterized membrane protein